MAKSKLKEATVRDFGGGWNVTDSEFNLKSNFLVVSDNIDVDSDRSLRVRFGTALFANFHDGDEDESSVEVDLEVVDTESVITVTHTAHGFATGDHVTISGASTLGGIPAGDINRTHGIIVDDVDTYRFAVRSAATANDTNTETITIVHDDHTLGGNIIHGRYFQDYLIVFSDIGEVGRMAADGTTELIWSFEHSQAISGDPLPWRECVRVSTTISQSKLIAVNGKTRDKPLEIDNNATPVVTFLIDPFVSSNVEIPRGDYVISLNTYLIIAASENGDADATLSISASNQPGVFATAGVPDDAVDVDLTAVTSSVDPRITGVGFLRDKLVVTFTDSAVLGILGIYTGAVHEPDFSDLVAQHGCLNGNTLISLGNDVLMTDYVGVPSITISQLSGTFVPERVSQLIDNALQKHLARLSSTTVETGVFATYDIRKRRYMLFVPKYDEVAQTLPAGPVTMDTLLGAVPGIMLHAPGHNIEEGDMVVVAGAPTILDLDASSINGTRQVVHVLDPDHIIIEVDGQYTGSNTGLGGSGISITPVNDETICYVYTNNPPIKAFRWTRYRGLNYAWAAVSAKGRIFAGRGGKVYQLGSEEEPHYGDEAHEYDAAAWANNTAYETDYRVLDGDVIWVAQEDHTSTATGSFATERNTYPDRWYEYKGRPITFAAETPWSDLKNRGNVKNVRYVTLDATGSAPFSFMMFHDKIYKDLETYQLSPGSELLYVGAPAASLGLAGDEALGFGESSHVAALGARRTREQHLWSMPVRGKLLKLRFEGQVTDPLKITAATLHYLEGSLHR